MAKVIKIEVIGRQALTHFS